MIEKIKQLVPEMLNRLGDSASRREYLGGSDIDTALVLASYGAGSMLAALALPGLLDARPDRPFMLGGCALLCLGLGVGVAMPGYPEIYIVWFLLGIGGSLIQTPAGRLLKRSSNAENRPEIYAAHFALSHACWLLAYPLNGWVGTWLGLDATFAILAALCLISGIAGLRLWPQQDEVVRVHTHAAVTHSHLHAHDEHHHHEHESWDGNEPHSHVHDHDTLTHEHEFVIDRHHLLWPTANR